MTLQQLKYIVEIANRGSMSEAANRLFISQPSLSSAVKELETELGITIFLRSNRGVTLTNEGADFLGHARQVLQQMDLLEDKFTGDGASKQKFSVSTHHYLFAANAFVDLIKEFGGDEYEFALRETKTYEIIEDVKQLRSEIGLIYLSEFNRKIMTRLLYENDLIFNSLLVVDPHIFISKENPLARKKNVDLNELESLTCITYEQGVHNSFYYSEEILSTLPHKKVIKVSDRAAVVNLLIGIDAYIISTGIFPSYLHGEDIVAVPLNVDEIINVGIIMRKDYTPSKLCSIYIEALKRIAEQHMNS